MAAKKEQKKLCFVVGPIGAEDSDDRIHADWLLEEIIQPVMIDFAAFEVQRADQITQPGLIDAQIINALLNAELVIADLSTLNPNAFYEIGIRHMAQKPIIHIQLADEKIPFDVSLYRAIKFSRTRPRDLRLAREALKLQIEAVLTEGFEVENPVTSARGRLKLEQHATAPQQVLLKEINALRSRIESLENVPARMATSKPWKRNSPVNVQWSEGAAQRPAKTQAITVGIYFDPSKEPEKLEKISNALNAIAPGVKPVEMTNDSLTYLYHGPPVTAELIHANIAYIPGVGLLEVDHF